MEFLKRLAEVSVIFVICVLTAVNFIVEFMFALVSVFEILNAAASQSVPEVLFYSVCFSVFMALFLYELADLLVKPETFVTRVWLHVLGVVSRLVLIALAGLILYYANFNRHLDWETQIYWCFNILSICMLLYNIPSLIFHSMLLSSKNQLDAKKFLDKVEENTVAEKKEP